MFSARSLESERRFSTNSRSIDETGFYNFIFHFEISILDYIAADMIDKI
jgi:hypothetical protein